jgi:hypothetical protein
LGERHERLRTSLVPLLARVYGRCPRRREAAT